MLKKLLAALVAAGFALPAFAETQLSVGQDMIHARGAQAVDVRHVARYWSAYALLLDGHPHVGADATLPTRFVNVSLGAAVSKADDIVGTPLRYEIRLERALTTHVVLQIVHESNCASVCKMIPGAKALPHGHAPNSGYNILTIGYRW